MEAYGLFFALAGGAVLWGMAWIAAGLLLQVASGVFGHPEQDGTGLTNPFVFLKLALRKIRNKVQGWDDRG